MRWLKPEYEVAQAVLTTMHGKERVIAPLLAAEIGLPVELANGVDTDRFGTFSREVERTGTPLQAARAKIAAGFAASPGAQIGLASEGSFAPHPTIPFLAVGRELVLMIDRKSGLELAGLDITLETNFQHAVVTDIEGALAFARKIDFPQHGLIVLGCHAGRPVPELFVEKAATDVSPLKRAVGRAIAICSGAFLETDMRADRNPTRMAAIERATRDLIRRLRQPCPQCSYPGFDIVDHRLGLPCSFCGGPTSMVRLEILGCVSCGHRLDRSAATAAAADPTYCPTCNP